LAYHMGDFTPHITVGRFEQNNGREQDSTTVGLRYELNEYAALKFDWSMIDASEPFHDDGEGWHRVEAAGLFFDGLHDEGDVNVFAITLDIVF